MVGWKKLLTVLFNVKNSFKRTFLILLFYFASEDFISKVVYLNLCKWNNGTLLEFTFTEVMQAKFQRLNWVLFHFLKSFLIMSDVQTVFLLLISFCDYSECQASYRLFCVLTKWVDNKFRSFIFIFILSSRFSLDVWTILCLFRGFCLGETIAAITSHILFFNLHLLRTNLI